MQSVVKEEHTKKEFQFFFDAVQQMTAWNDLEKKYSTISTVPITLPCILTFAILFYLLPQEVQLRVDKLICSIVVAIVVGLALNHIGKK